MDSITVIQKGFYTTIQDKGRTGYAALGVPVSGAMDQAALQLSNLLLNNTEDAAALECTLVGPTLLFHSDRAFVLTGAKADAFLDSKPLKRHQVYFAKKGQQLTVGKISEGCRTYVGVDGGICTSVQFGSRSLLYPITEKNTIQTGTQLKLGAPNYGLLKGSKVHIENPKHNNVQTIIKGYKGPEFEVLPVAVQEDIENLEFKVTSWNRMGIQLDAGLQPTKNSILTSPVLPGTVQLTPSGSLYVLMRDCQITGGYPRVLQLTVQAINHMAQKQHGDTVSLAVI